MDQSKKECILTAAVRSFTRFGFKKASVDDIAKDAGVAKGTIYLAADNKEDLFFQALNREVREWVGELSRLIDPRAPADATLLMLARETAQRAEGRPLVWALLSGEDERLLPQWRDRLEELRTLCSRNFQEVLELGVRQGRFRPLDVPATVRLLLDIVVAGLLFHAAPAPDRADRIARWVESAFDVVLKGLGGAAPVAGSPPVLRPSIA